MRREVPKKYRGLYERAMRGKSRKAAMHAFCLECCYWQIKEVQLCSDDGCPLFPYRPRARILPKRSYARTNIAESTRSAD
jgi:hypothetical protein